MWGYLSQREGEHTASLALRSAPGSLGAMAVLTVRFLFSPWLLVAIAILAWIKFRPRRSRR